MNLGKVNLLLIIVNIIIISIVSYWFWDMTIDIWSGFSRVKKGSLGILNIKYNSFSTPLSS